MCLRILETHGENGRGRVYQISVFDGEIETP